MADLLLHSMKEFKEITERILSYVKPKTIVEVGSEYGGSTKILLEYAMNNDSFVYVIDPYPYLNLEKELIFYKEYYSHLENKSLDILSSLSADIYFLDGDHNYWTVKNELQLIYSMNPDAWVVLHDVSWPCDYRDLYYNPDNIPNKNLNPFSYDYGVLADNSISDQFGFNGSGKFAFSIKYGGEENGVLKAVEDFICEHNSLSFNKINPVFGLGVLTPKKEDPFVKSLLTPYSSQLINTMEENRIDLYLRVLQLQKLLSWEHKKQEDREKNFLYRIARKLSKSLKLKNI